MDFWLGQRLGLPSLDSHFLNLKGKVGRELDSTPPLFLNALTHVSSALESEVFSTSEIEDITTKEIYKAYISKLPPPNIQLRYPDQDWPLTWERLQSRVLSSKAKSFLYLIVHERVGTRERGHRLMPGRFNSSICSHCEEVESSAHRYLYCSFVADAWAWVRRRLDLLDTSTVLFTDYQILRLDFFKSLRENAIVWLIGTFIELVENDVVLRGNKLNCVSIKGFFKQKKQYANNLDFPELGIIPGIDWDSDGIG